MHLTVLNLQLQGWDRVITHMCDAVRVFQAKLSLWESQLQQGNLGHFPCCQTMTNQVSVGAAQFHPRNDASTLLTSCTNALYIWKHIPVWATFLCDEDEQKITQVLCYGNSQNGVQLCISKTTPNTKHYRTSCQEKKHQTLANKSRMYLNICFIFAL